jgi:hypothetical protein
MKSANVNKVKLKDLKPNGVYYHIEQDMIMLGFLWERSPIKDEKYFRMFNIDNSFLRENIYVFSCNQESTNEVIYIGDL